MGTKYRSPGPAWEETIPYVHKSQFGALKVKNQCICISNYRVGCCDSLYTTLAIKMALQVHGRNTESALRNRQTNPCATFTKKPSPFFENSPAHQLAYKSVVAKKNSIRLLLHHIIIHFVSQLPLLASSETDEPQDSEIRRHTQMSFLRASTLSRPRSSLHDRERERV